MTALAADKNVQSLAGVQVLPYPVADNVVIYKGAQVCLNAAGYAAPAADTSGFSPVIGIADSTVDNTIAGHANGGLTVDVISGRATLLVGVDLTQALVGRRVFVQDDATVCADADSVNKISAGILYRYVSATSGYVFQVGGLSALDDTINTADITNAAVTEAKLQAATDNALGANRIAHYRWTFAGQGGDYDAVGGIPFSGAALPLHALVHNSFIKVNTPPTGATNASIQLLTAGDIVASAAIAGEPWSVAEPELGVCVHATEATWLETTDALTKPALVGTVADFTAGDIECWLEYVVAAA